MHEVFLNFTYLEGPVIIGEFVFSRISKFAFSVGKIVSRYGGVLRAS